jgi:protein-ribulosamine 3-kinase
MILKNIQSMIRTSLPQKGYSSPGEPQLHSVGGGSINETYRLTFGDHQFFCKINSATKFPQLFQKEKNGLQRIAAQGFIKTPEVIDCFESGNHQVLLLEWINSGQRTVDFWKKFGEQLAALHQVSSENFGLDENNYMGSVRQLNRYKAYWSEFFISERLMPLIQECRDKGLLGQTHAGLFESLIKKVPQIFTTSRPSLVHGDLWSGNFMCNENNEPVLIDPAVYYGHASVDLGMTTLFGGFDPAFYKAYNYHSPFPVNHKEQWQICNLYPLLIHLLLFGRSYLSQIEYTLKQFA